MAQNTIVEMRFSTILDSNSVNPAQFQIRARNATNTGYVTGDGSGMDPAGNMESLLFGADSAGYNPRVHAIGDEAVDSIVNVMEELCLPRRTLNEKMAKYGLQRSDYL